MFQETKIIEFGSMFLNSFEWFPETNIDGIPERIPRTILSTIPDGKQEEIFEGIC